MLKKEIKFISEIFGYSDKMNNEEKFNYFNLLNFIIIKYHFIKIHFLNTDF